MTERECWVRRFTFEDGSCMDAGQNPDGTFACEDIEEAARLAGKKVVVSVDDLSETRSIKVL